jgi:hypothetical protein
VGITQRRGLALALTIVIAMAGCVAACTLLVDTDGFDSLGAISPTDDGGPRLNGSDGGGGAIPNDDSGAVVVEDAGGGDAACPSFALLCDDFEGTQPTTDKWAASEKLNGGFVEVVTTRAHAGTHSARAVANALVAPTDGGSNPPIRANLRVNLNQRLKTGMLVLRSYVLLTKQLRSDTTILKMHAVGTDDMNVKTGLTGSIKVDSDTDGAGPDRLANGSMPLNKWVCLEWRATLGAAGHQTLLMDNSVIVDVDENLATDDGWDSVSVGFFASDGDFSQEAFFDDVVVAKQPVGCLP